MFKVVKQSVIAQAVTLETFVDAVDGRTYETALTGSTVRRSTNGAAFEDAPNTLGAHAENGAYFVDIDFPTVGMVLVRCDGGGAARMVDQTFLVLPANVYDSLTGSDLLQTDATQIEGTDATDALDARLAAQLGTVRINQRAGKAFRLELSSRRDDTYRATRPVRLMAGTVTAIAVEIDVAPVYGDLDLATVGTPVVPGGTSLTCSALGHRNDSERRLVMVQLGGTATAGEEVQLSVPFTMASGEGDSLEFTVEVRASGAA